MRSAAFIAVFLSLSAAACPDLSGNYKVCRSSLRPDRPGPGVLMKQTVNSGVTTYTAITEDHHTGVSHTDSFIADGTPRVMEEGSDGDITYKMTYSCHDNLLIVNSTVEQTRERRSYTIDLIGSMEKIDNKLVIKASGKIILGEDGSITSDEKPDTIICE